MKLLDWNELKRKNRKHREWLHWRYGGSIEKNLCAFPRIPHDTFVLPGQSSNLCQLESFIMIDWQSNWYEIQGEGDGKNHKINDKKKKEKRFSWVLIVLRINTII